MLTGLRTLIQARYDLLVDDPLHRSTEPSREPRPAKTVGLAPDVIVAGGTSMAAIVQQQASLIFFARSLESGLSC
jgi:hypothetical protein